ncbi:MAG: hypothetical protein R3B45_00290 [Bdellovibrionota bacterium]
MLEFFKKLLFSFLFLLSFFVKPAYSNSDKLSMNVVRIDKTRYEQFLNNKGSVFIPSIYFNFEENAKKSLCIKHVKDKSAQVLIKGAELSQGAIENKIQIVKLINKCSRNAIDAPTGLDYQTPGLNVKIESVEINKSHKDK